MSCTYLIPKQQQQQHRETERKPKNKMKIYKSK